MEEALINTDESHTIMMREMKVTSSMNRCLLEIFKHSDAQKSSER